MLINIDYLIINLTGKFQPVKNETEFLVKDLQKSTRNFQKMYEIYYKDLKLGTMLSQPYENSVIDHQLNQLQVENNLFYTVEKQKLKSILFDFVTSYELSYTSINRLDICIDKIETSEKEIFTNIFNRKMLLSGREKKIAPHFISTNGILELEGLTIGKRSSSRYLRIYNKTKELEKGGKDYIKNYHLNNGLAGNVWRYEYQLNNKFFKSLNYTQMNITETLCWNIFNYDFLKEIFEIAKKNHFVLKENTGKSEINKEKEIEFINVENLQNTTERVVHISKLNTSIENKTLAIKRTIKTLLKEYFEPTKPKYEYILPIQLLLDNYNLNDWFSEKLPMYIAEFKENQKTNLEYDINQLKEDLKLCI